MGCGTWLLRLVVVLSFAIVTSMHGRAQTFFNLTAQEVCIDSLLPVFRHTLPLGSGYADSLYTVSIEYPEFVDVDKAEELRLQSLVEGPLPAMPEVAQTVSVSRKQGLLTVSFVPIVFRDGRYQKLVSFKIAMKSALRPSRRAATGDYYAQHSALSSGQWAKIRVPSTGIYQLTEELVRQAGFSSLDRVKVYGYGGGLQPERLTADYLAQTDDLPEVATCKVGNRRLFYAVGPVTWDSNNRRVRNPYSDYGYYFLTENDSTPLLLSEAELLAASYPLADDYNTLYEVDDYSWYHGGRNLYDARELAAGSSREYSLASTGTSATGSMTIVLSADATTTANIVVNGAPLGTMTVSGPGSYDKMRTATNTFRLSNLQADNTITISTVAGGGTTRLDYISIHADEPVAAPDLTQAFPVPEYVYSITNQDHHAAEAADMIIVIPTSQKLLQQAQRLKALHEQHDSLRVRIVPADELYNEFSSGTPDANAYRRYMKMLYDRAETEADMPRYLLLLGDGAWDNRMRTSDWRTASPDDYLLCYESDNSYSEVDCYVSDDYFCMLDDNEGGNLLSSDKADVAVGRISARTADQAAIAVDKIESYMNNDYAGAWQNIICMMGDDGNQNAHMQDADSVAKMIEQLYPTLQVKRIMWDAYTRVSSSTGNSYPDVTRLIKQQMQQGALIMNYSGHGRADAMSHEYVLRLPDFEEFASPRLPLWITASCDIMPFDGQEDNIGETAIFNSKGGAISFFGTTRTVYQSYNKLMNIAFTRHVLSRRADGSPMPVGEAVRQAKNELMSTGIVTGMRNGTPIYSTDRTANKLQYTLLGDPALALALPTMGIQVDSINGMPTDASQTQSLSAGSRVTISGRTLNTDGTHAADYDGMLTAVVRDASELIVCKLNDTSKDGADEAFSFYDRPNVIFSGSDSIRQGRFSFTFAVPKDISYSEATGLVSLYAISNDKRREASGICEQLSFNGSAGQTAAGSGPAVYCYLNSADFANGGSVNTTPYFVAELSDEDGINATGTGIGHDLQLIIDGDMAKTYSLNDYFRYDFGSYTRGSLGFSIPELSYGQHRLLFRAWDILNNSTTAELTFNVVKGLQPTIADVECTANPATTSTSFRILHDRTGSQMDIVLEVFDTSGRHLWTHAETGVSTDSTYTVDWDLCMDGGRRLETGVYLYRVRISSDGSTYASKAKKLIVLTR
ncbi:MAG: type IX secretion system sortase PorU [Prevotella sp.]|nr:type IX secretion system sortase PorU [Prevotella sp.]